MIGTGVFGAAGFLAEDLGRPSLVLGVWVVGALVAMAGCLSYAELGINFPRSGGEYVYIREIWGPLWGFLSGWISFFAGFSAPIAAGALLFAEYLGHYFPLLSSGRAVGPVEGWKAIFNFGYPQGVAIAVIGVFTFLNVLGISLAARVQNLLTAAKVAILGAFIVLAFSVGEGSWDHFALTTASSSPFGPGAQFGISLVLVMYSYSGWNAATYVTEEMKTPECTLPLALAGGTFLVALFYVLLNASFVYALPLKSLRGVLRVGAVAATALFGGRWGDLLIAIMGLCILSSVSAMVIVGLRVYYAMSQDGCFLPSVARLSPRSGAPAKAILFQGIFAAVLVVTSTFEALAYYIGVALLVFAALATAGVFRMRRRPGWKHLGPVSFLYPLVPALFVFSSLWMIGVTLWFQSSRALWSLLTIALGALVYRMKFQPIRHTHP
jgi:APA family basic amino acid/polyamine antiporter